MFVPFLSLGEVFSYSLVEDVSLPLTSLPTISIIRRFDLLHVIPQFLSVPFLPSKFL